MYNTCEAFEKLKEYLVTNCGAKIASGGKEVIKRCHKCGDSKDPRKAHMYIGMKDNNIVYNCFLCGGGIVDQQFFRDINCYDTDLINSVIRQNKIINQNKTIIYRKNINRVINNSIDIPNYDMKVDYLKNRLGYSLDHVLNHLKIILSLKNYLAQNHITYYTRDPRIIEDLDKYFIGFLCVDNNQIIMRRVVDSGIVHSNCDTRYVVYVCDNRFIDKNSKIYIIPTAYDMSRLYNRIDIHIAEGPFDILGVYINVKIDSNIPNIYAAVGGKNYQTAINYIVKRYGFINFNLHFYLDKDVDSYIETVYRKLYSPFGCKIFIHRNGFENEKDYGVPMDRIKDVVKQIC